MTPMRRVAALILALLALALVGAACGGDDDEGGALEEGAAFKVGYGNNLTGFLAVHDKLISNGALVAVDEINNAGGIDGKVRIDLELADTKSDPAASVTATNDLIAKDVQAIVLPCNTDFQLAMAAVTQREDVLTISPCNADPTAPAKFDVYWPVGMGGNAQGAQLAGYVADQGYKNAYVLDSNFLYINLMSKYFTKAAEDRGITISGKDNIPFGATGFPTDFSPQVTKIKNASPKPDVIMTALFTPFVNTLVKQLRAQGIDTPVVGTDGMDTGLHLKAGGASAEGTVFTTFGFPEEGSATDKFYDQYADKFGSRPDGSFTALGYEAIKVLEAAIKKAGSTDPADIREALSDGLEVDGALGKITYAGGGEHNPENEVAVVKVEGGKFVLVEKGVPEKVPEP
jgi:branched-chain amino acid transport system substrate-binding protein